MNEYEYEHLKYYVSFLVLIWFAADMLFLFAVYPWWHPQYATAVWFISYGSLAGTGTILAYRYVKRGDFGKIQ